MHDFSVFRTVSGPYDVPLDDPKQRFGQQRRKNRPRPCCRSPFLYGSTLDLRGISSRSSKRPHVEVRGCGRRRRCRAPCLGRARTRARPCAPPRPVLHSSQRAAPYPSSPHPPRLGKQLAPTPGRSRTLVPKKRRGAYRRRPRYRPSAGVEPSGGEPHPRPARFMPLPMRLGTHVLSHPPPVRARRSAARGQCGRAELALRHRCLRCRPGGAAARAEGLSWPQIG